MTRVRAYLSMALHVVCAALTYVLVKPAAVQFASPAALTMLRAGGAALLVLLLTGSAIPRPRFTPREWLQVGGLGVLLVPLNQYVFVRGMRHTAPSHPALLYALTPVVVLLMTAALERRAPSRGRALGVLLALAGVLVLLRPWESGTQAAALRHGDLWIAVGVLVWAAYTIAARVLAKRHDARVVTAWSLVIGALVLLPFCVGPLRATDYAAVDARGWVGVAWLAAVTSTFMMLLWNGMLRHLEPVQVAICANAQPAATAALSALLAWAGWLRGDQDLGPAFWTGGALVLAGVVLVQRRR